MNIFNTEVYGLAESIIRSGYPMKTKIINMENINSSDYWDLQDAITFKDFVNPHIKRAIKLANAGSGHNNYLKGIIVQMDVEAPQYVWMQLERYQFFTIISSQSKMHRLTQMDMSDGFLDGMYCSSAKETAEDFIQLFKGEKIGIDDMLGNVPMGLELTAGISTNYLCLKNMYHQRKNHRLKFWNTVFVEWIKSLPMSNVLIMSN